LFKSEMKRARRSGGRQQFSGKEIKRMWPPQAEMQRRMVKETERLRDHNHTKEGKKKRGEK